MTKIEHRKEIAKLSYFKQYLPGPSTEIKIPKEWFAGLIDIAENALGSVEIVDRCKKQKQETKMTRWERLEEWLRIKKFNFKHRGLRKEPR